MVDVGATAVLPQHVNTPAKLERVVALLTGFRLYMHYHIKATKSYLHSRMRERVDKLLQGAWPSAPSPPTHPYIC